MSTTGKLIGGLYMFNVCVPDRKRAEWVEFDAGIRGGLLSTR
jgi:hypothetical protein